jgi:hypothetical protein
LTKEISALVFAALVSEWRISHFQAKRAMALPKGLGDLNGTSIW